MEPRRESREGGGRKCDRNMFQAQRNMEDQWGSLLLSPLAKCRLGDIYLSI